MSQSNGKGVAFNERSGFATREGVIEGNVVHKPRQGSPRGSNPRKTSGAKSTGRVIWMAGHSSSFAAVFWGKIGAHGGKYRAS